MRAPSHPDLFVGFRADSRSRCEAPCEELGFSAILVLGETAGMACCPISQHLAFDPGASRAWRLLYRALTSMAREEVEGEFEAARVLNLQGGAQLNAWRPTGWASTSRSAGGAD